jgi:hypothetical protein
LKANRHSGARRQSFSGQIVTLDRFHRALGFAGPDALAKLMAVHASDVCFGSLADISIRPRDVRFTPESGYETVPFGTKED